MGEFNRDFKKIDTLQNEQLFQEKLLHDIIKGEVFPAFRGGGTGYMSFYYKGGGIFEYNTRADKFTTHISYAFHLDTENGEQKKNYIIEEEIEKLKPVRTFVEGYEKIKSKCAEKGNEEATRVSDFYIFNGTNKNSVILLDTEINLVDEGKSNRIDLLFYHIELKTLFFVEAKLDTNAEMQVNGKNPPLVKNQLERYNFLVEKNKDILLREYTRYIEQFNQLFGTKLPEPVSLCLSTGLIVFVEDTKGKEDIVSATKKGNYLDGVPCYIFEKNNRINQNILGEMYRDFVK